MTSPENSTIAQLRAMREKYQAEGKAGGGSPDELFMRTEDKMFGWFLWDGRDNSGENFRYYLAHEYPAVPPARFNSARPCLLDVAGDANCPGCAAGLKTKPRMAMKFFVYGIFHQVLRENESFPIQTFANVSGFFREVNGIRIWDTSAWRDSPFDDILAIAEQYTLNAMMFQLYASGADKSRRYKPLPLFQYGAVDPNALAKAMQESRLPGVTDWLKSRSAPVATVAAAAPGAPPIAAPTQEREYTMVGGKLQEVAAPVAAAPMAPPVAAAPMAPPAAPVAAAPVAAAPVAAVAAPPAPVPVAVPAPAPIPVVVQPAPPPPPAPPVTPEAAAPIQMPDTFVPTDDELMADAAAEVAAAPAPTPVPAPSPIPLAAPERTGKGLF